MQSDFERNAAKVAVDAVEARWRHQQDQKRRQERIRRWKNLLFLGGVLFLAVAGVAVWQCAQGESPFASIRPMFANASDYQVRTSYATQLHGLLVHPVKLLSELPAEANPKRAVQGTAFPVLSLTGKSDFTLYSLKADGKGGFTVTECSPLSEGHGLVWGTFKNQCQKPYLLGVGESVYLCGSKNLKDAERIRRQVRTWLGVSE